MSWELIGSCGSGQDWQLQVGLAYLSSVFEEPEDCELDIMYTDHEFGDGTIGAYASIGLSYESPVGGLVQFASRCQDVLSAFDQNMAWSKISPETLAERFDYQIGASGLLKVLDETAPDETEDEDE